ncbi:MAG: IS3 family transposase [Actinomycetia bacterium]|nr:IS3 family transposase [Actinomycetes bacterium]
MQTPRSSFYYKPAGTNGYDANIADKINEIALEFPSYGYRRVTAALAREDMIVNHKKVYRIMKSENILCKIRRSFRKTTNSNHNFVKYPNLIKGIIPLRVNEIWHADITYIRLRASFAYLAALIDGLSRKVVGYALGRTLCAELTVQALLDALSNRNISGELTHHSDQGIQYCSQEYINILQKNNIKISMSERANPYDNAKMESFFRTLKVEEVYMFEYDNFEEALEGLTHFIEEVYNSKRLHSSLGYMPPEEFEYKFNNKKSTRQLVLT